MYQICRVDVVERAEGVVHHCDDVVFFEYGSPVDRVQDLLEVRFYKLDDQEYLLEVAQVHVLVLIQLVLDEFICIRGSRDLSILISLLLGHADLRYVETRRDDVIQFCAENVIFHESEFAQNLYLPEDLAGRVLVVKTIAYLFYRNFFV